MKSLKPIACALIVGSWLFGCATTHVVPEPRKISFENAMEQVAHGLNKMYTIGKEYPKSGLTPAEVTIEFYISAKASDEGKLSIEATLNPSEALKLGKAGAEIGSELETARGNKITVKLVNLFLYDTKDALIVKKDPEAIAELLKVLKDYHIEPVLKGR